MPIPFDKIKWRGTLERLHCYTRRSVGKTIALNVLLLGLVLLADSGLKNSIKQAAEW